MPLKFARVKEGPRAGELVPTMDVNPSTNLTTEPTSPPNPYASGFGKQIPTRYKVRVFDQRWRRVYVCQFSNAGTAYIIHKGEKFAVTW